MNKLKVRFTEHSLEQVERRKISIEVLEKVITNPDQKFVDKDDRDRKICQSKIFDNLGRQKLLRAVIEETGKEIVVVTAYITSKIEKYWSENENKI